MTRAWPRAALLLAALAATAHADRLVLKDGRELTGEVIAESGDHLRFDARAIEEGPIARVQIPQRMPFGFHANWFASKG